MNNINQIENKTIQELYEDSLALKKIEEFLRKRRETPFLKGGADVESENHQKLFNSFQTSSTSAQDLIDSCEVRE